MAIVAANELLELDALAVFRDLTKAIVLHGRNLGEFHRTRNLAFGLTPLARWPRNEGRRAGSRTDTPACQLLGADRRLT